MRDDELEALLRRALREDPWRPDVVASRRKLVGRFADDEQEEVRSWRGRWLGRWTAAAHAALAPVAVVAAVVALGLVPVLAPGLLSNDKPASSRQDGLIAAGGPASSGVLPASPGVLPSDRQALAKVPQRNATVTQPYAPEQVCGRGFTVIDQHKLPLSVVYLLWNASKLENCVVTLKKEDVGVRTRTAALLEPAGAEATRDAGDYRYYADVKTRAPGCIVWGGSDGRGMFTSPAGEHCSPR